MPQVEVTRTYLRMTAPAELRARRVQIAGASVKRINACTPEQYRRLYHDVGSAWHWRDRDSWTDERLAAHLATPGVAIFELRLDGETAGYFELQRHAEGDVELVYFGLVPAYIGRGLGAHLLTAAVEEAWRMGASRLWLHTCTLDHPAALPNYRARGFTEFRTERYLASIPEPSGP